MAERLALGMIPGTSWRAREIQEVAHEAEEAGFDAVFTTAETHYREALSLAATLGMRPLVAHCHLGLGTLYAGSERLVEARVELALAAELYRTMEMTWWLSQAEGAFMRSAMT